MSSQGAKMGITNLTRKNAPSVKLPTRTSTLLCIAPPFSTKAVVYTTTTVCFAGVVNFEITHQASIRHSQ